MLAATKRDISVEKRFVEELLLIYRAEAMLFPRYLLRSYAQEVSPRQISLPEL